jgi:hypothetical protein
MIQVVEGTILKSHLKHCSKGLKSNKSSGELKVESILHKYNIDFWYDANHNGLKGYNGRGYLRFDFGINLEDGDICFIEYDGIQHFRPSQFGSQTKEDGEEAFEIQQENDKIKDNYCKDNEYMLLRIPYTVHKIDDMESIIVDFLENNNIDCS